MVGAVSSHCHTGERPQGCSLLGIVSSSLSWNVLAALTVPDSDEVFNLCEEMGFFGGGIRGFWQGEGVQGIRVIPKSV